jgi:Ala-tRNA(Pro) deacylase
MFGKIEVLKLLMEKDIPHTSEEHESVLAGTRCKNLLLQDKKGNYYLVVTTSSKSLDLLAVAKSMSSGRLSFASAENLLELLGVRAGSLSPLALVNDEGRRVRLVVDLDLADEQAFLFHPLESNASVSLSRAALDDFMTNIDRQADWLNLPERAA